MDIDTIIAKFRALLQAEPLRAIGYGAVVVVFIVTRAAAFIGHPLGAGEPTLDEITIAVAAAVTAVTEFARRYVTPA